MENQDTVGVGKSSNPPTRRPRSKRSSGAPTWVANVTMLALGIIIGFTGHWLLTSAISSTPASPFDALVNRTRHFKGNANAPVTIVEFSDFQ